MAVSKDDDKPIRVEAEAMRALMFYQANYEMLVFRGLKRDGVIEVLGPKPRHCRFCGKNETEVKFSKDAHVIPAFVGNKTLFSREECNFCNDRFSSFEDDLAKMTMGERALGQVPKRHGFTSLKPQGKKSSYERGATGVIIKQYEDEGVFTIDEVNSRIVTQYDTQPHRPLGAYKALAKMAFGLLPSSELPLFEPLRLWLLEPDVLTGRVYSEGGHICYQSVVPGPSPFPVPTIALLRRKERVRAPYLTFFIAFGNFTYQIFPPCPSQDSHLGESPMDVMIYPHLYMLQPWLARGVVQRGLVSMDSASRAASPVTLNLHFDNMVRAGQPSDVEPHGRPDDNRTT